MGINSFSPFSSLSTGASVLLAPIQALIAVFAPARHARVIPCTTASYCVPATAYPTPFQARSKQVQKNVGGTSVQRLKIVRQFEPGASRSCAGRLVISGRMSDVCAELERMAG